MKKLIAITLVAVAALPAFAEKKAGFLRGGFGFLFPDANQFVNAGQMALNKGTGVAANYVREDETDSQSATPSVVWANGHWGFGAGVTRSGMDLDNAQVSSDQLSMQAGTAVANNLTFGTVYRRSLDTAVVGEDHVSSQLNIHFGKGGGLVLGMGVGTTLGRETNTRDGRVALGYSHASGFMTEVGYEINNFELPSSEYTYTGSLVYNAKNWYFAGQYNHVKSGDTEPNNGAARLGLLMGQVDLSAQVARETYTGGNTTYGGTFRVVF